MSQMKDDEPLLPPWAMSFAKILVPLLVVIGLWWLMGKLHLPTKIVTPALAVLAIFIVTYVGGRYYKPFRYDKRQGRCIAKNAKERMSCRHYMAGAQLGRGCGRQREDRGCRYVKRGT